MSLKRKMAAEFLGTAGLLAVVVGSGIMGERLAGGNLAVVLLANSLATGAGLIFLIYGLADISAAHFNPAITLTGAVRRKLGWSEAASLIGAQLIGAISGVALANAMFELPLLFISTKERTGSALFLSEIVATFGLIAVIRTGEKFRPHLIGVTVACYITAAYWFTSSTSFANPAVTVARSLSDTFTGIAPAGVPAFVAAQIIGAFTATVVFDWLLGEITPNE